MIAAARFPMHWLAIAAAADWLLARTITRSAIFMPKSPLVISIYQVLGAAGLVAAALTSLLALAAMFWIAWRYSRGHARGGVRILAAGLWASLALLSLVFVFAAPVGWLAVGYHGLLLAAVALLLARLLASAAAAAGVARKLAGALVALALLASGSYQVLPAIYTAAGWPGPPLAAGAFFNLGELLAVLAPLALWLAYGRGASWRAWLAAAVPAALFVALRLASPAMAGIIAIWSVGLSLYLPWPLYALSLWLAGVVALRARGGPAAWAMLLLLAGGYAPQLSTQAFLGLVALWLLLGEMGSSAKPALAGSTTAPRHELTPTGRQPAAG